MLDEYEEEHGGAEEYGEPEEEAQETHSVKDGGEWGFGKGKGGEYWLVWKNARGRRGGVELGRFWPPAAAVCSGGRILRAWFVGDLRCGWIAGAGGLR